MRVPQSQNGISGYGEASFDFIEVTGTSAEPTRGYLSAQSPSCQTEGCMGYIAPKKAQKLFSLPGEGASSRARWTPSGSACSGHPRLHIMFTHYLPCLYHSTQLYCLLISPSVCLSASVHSSLSVCTLSFLSLPSHPLMSVPSHPYLRSLWLLLRILLVIHLVILQSASSWVLTAVLSFWYDDAMNYPYSHQLAQFPQLSQPETVHQSIKSPGPTSVW